MIWSKIFKPSIRYYKVEISSVIMALQKINFRAAPSLLKSLLARHQKLD